MSRQSPTQYHHSHEGGRMETDTSYLTEQVANIIAQLHGLFDEIGVPRNERDARESELFAALSETLENKLKSVSNEKHDLHTTAKRLATTIKQLQASLEDRGPDGQSPRFNDSDPELQVTYPLRDCIARLKEKHHDVQSMHQERLDQVNKLVNALTSYSSHLDPSLVTIPLPPSPCPATFSLSPTYISELDNAFTSVYEVYQSRVAHVRSLATELITLWAELGTPSAQTDPRIVECAEPCPEQLGLREADIKRLQATRDRFANEKAGRERRMNEIGEQIQGLWERLGVEQQYRVQFERRNRGVGMKVLNEYEDELRRLLEMKRQNLGVFVEEARVQLQALWDELFFSEEEMLAFTPAFSDVHTDALLASHEAEIARLSVIQSERAPILELVSKHRSILEDRASLAASSQDASRLMMRGQKGEKRDPGKLLREEKMRKRIQKELPKVEAELRKMLMNWEAEYGREFLVWGERYLDELEDGAVAEVAKKQPTRSKTPVASAPPAKNPKFSASTAKPPGTLRGAPQRSKTPTPYTSANTNGTIRPAQHTRSKTAGSISPSKIPARVPLYPTAGNAASPTRSTYNKSTAQTSTTLGRQHAPPPRMDLSSFIPPRSQTPQGTSGNTSHLGSVVRSVQPEDVYDDSNSRQSRLRLQHLQGGSASVSAHSQMHADPTRAQSVQPSMYSRPPSSAASLRSVESGFSANQSHIGNSGTGSRAGWYPMAPPPAPASVSSYGANSYAASSGTVSRQISAGSSQSTQSGVVSGSENWETYSEGSGSEIGISHGGAGHHDVKGYDSRGYQFPAQEYMGKKGGHGGHPAVRGVEQVVEGEWTDEDGF